MNTVSMDMYDFLVSQATHLLVLFFVIWGLVSLCHKKSAHLRYLLWGMILVKCLMPPLFTIPMAVALMPRTIDSAEASDSRIGVKTLDYSVAFPHGSTVELVALCNYPSKDKSWWSPGGSLFTMDISTQDKSSYTSDDPGYEFVFRHTGDTPFKIDSIKGCKLKSVLDVLAPEALSGYRVHIPSQYKKIDMILATPTGAWNTVHASQSLNASTSATVRGKTLILAAMILAGEDCIMSCTDELGYKDATRIIVVDSRGHEHSGVDLTDIGIKGVRQRTIRYKKLALEDVAEVRFQVCAYEYVTLKNISLPPNTNADSEAELIDRGPMIPGHSFLGEDLLKILALISDEADYPIVADAKVLGVTSVSFEAVPLEVALDRVLAGTDYSWMKKDGVYWVSTTPANALSYEDRRELVRLMAVYARVAFSNDLQGAEEVYNFQSEAQKKRVLDMMRQENPKSSPTDDETRPVHVVQIEPTAGNQALVSALCPLGGRYIAHSVSWVRTDRGWKWAMDLTKVMEAREQVKTMGADAYGRLQLKTQLELWEDAQGSALVSLYEDVRNSLRRQLLMCQYAKLRHLDTLTLSRLKADDVQRTLDSVEAKTPEAYRAERIYRLKRQLGPGDQYGKLEFRMLRKSTASERSPSEESEAAEQRERNRLKNNGPLDESSQKKQAQIWLPLRPHPRTSFPDAIIETYQGQKYVLVSNQSEETMTADGSWGILAVSPQSDAMGRRAIGLELDQPGGENLRQITSQNIKRAMAIIVDGQVLSAPTITTTVGPHVIITGQFTDQEARDMMVSLQKGMRPKLRT